MTAIEVAEFVGCHEQTVRRAYLRGRLGWRPAKSSDMERLGSSRSEVLRELEFKESQARTICNFRFRVAKVAVGPCSFLPAAEFPVGVTALSSASPSEDEDALARRLGVEEFVGSVRFIEREPVRQQLLQRQPLVYDEARALGLPHGAEGP
jgi:hypothetical protein